MIPFKLTLKGFLSYLDETVVDLSAVEVACISGPNGAGKSSLLDAITWSLFGRARRSDDALINDAADACAVTFEFEYENSRYRIQRQKTREKGASLEFHIQSDENSWKVLTEAGLRATELRIRDILRLDYDTFINASFFLQGKADMFTQQNPSRRKEILSSILGLDAWESYREEASARRRSTTNEVKGLRTWLDEIIEELSHESEKQERLKLLQANLQKTEVMRQEKENQLAVAKQAAQALRLESEKLSLMEAQLSGAKKRLENTDALLTARTDELELSQELMVQAEEIERAHQSWRTLQAELERQNGLAAENNKLQSRKALQEADMRTEEARLKQELQNLIKEKEEINLIIQQLPGLKEELSALSAEQEKVDQKTSALPQLENALPEHQNTRADLQAENVQLKHRMNEIKERLQSLESAQGSQCPLCGQDLNEKHRADMLAKLEQEGRELGNKFRENANQIKKLESTIATLSTQISELRTIASTAGARQQKLGFMSSQVEDSEARVNRWESSGSPKQLQLEETLANNTYAQQEQQQIKELNAAINALGYDAEKHESIRAQEISQRVYEEKFQRLQTARTTQEGLERELETLRQTKNAIEEEITSQSRLFDDLKERITTQQEKLPDVPDFEAALNSLRQEENQLRRETGAAQQSVQVLEIQRQRHADLTEQIDNFNRQISCLKTLEAAFSKDGVPALLIEQALPEIESQANMVLDRLSDGRMSINFETEREYKDKNREDKKQTLDIVISDSAGRREYELFSGGEAFRINFAIRLALSRVLAGRAGARLQTLVIDEGFGSQDAEGRQRLIEAIRLVSPDFSKILVITHLEELKDAFPSRIEVLKTERGSTVEVIA